MTGPNRTVYAVLDGAGNVVNRYEYDSFGVIDWRHSFEGVPNRYTFQGRELDAERGDYYYRARIYDPDRGTFLGPDMNLAAGPFGEPNGMMSYVFCSNDPWEYVDPEGLRQYQGVIEARIGPDGQPQVRHRTLDQHWFWGTVSPVPGTDTDWESPTDQEKDYWFVAVNGQFHAVDQQNALANALHYVVPEYGRNVAAGYAVAAGAGALVAAPVATVSYAAETIVSEAIDEAVGAPVSILVNPTRAAQKGGKLILQTGIRSATKAGTRKVANSTVNTIGKRAAKQLAHSSTGLLPAGAASTIPQRQLDKLTKFLRKTVRQATREIDRKGMHAFSPLQRNALSLHPNLYAAFRGSAIDAQVRDWLNPLNNGRKAKQLERILNGLPWKGLPNNGPDFYIPGRNVWFDMTTQTQWGRHLKKYSQRFGVGIPLFTN